MYLLENIFNYLPIFPTDDEIKQNEQKLWIEVEKDKDYYDNLVKECNERRMEYEKKDDGEKLCIMTFIP